MHVFRKAAMHAHDFFIDECNKWHIVKAVVKRLPHGNFIASLNFIKKSINSCNGLRFMVSTQNYDLQWISYFKCKQEADNFTALLSSIDVVSHEEVSGIFRNDIV